MASPTLSSPTPSKFRFKQAPTHSSRSRSPETHSTHSHHRRHHHHHRSKRRRLSTTPPQEHPPLETLDPETAFRESLFDALADDEGAAYWEGVYGQPIHSYARPSSDGLEGLEAMSDEEYATYVRAKMWERTHQHVVEERAAREEDRARRKKREKREKEGRRWERGVEEALRRGEERKRGKKWKSAWEGYTKAWEGLGKGITERIPWPVESGRFEDVGKEGVERFFRGCMQYSGGNLGRVLKVERVRWHPDKMMQRAGGEGIDKETMGAVTAVFQVVDRLWGECKGG